MEAHEEQEPVTDTVLDEIDGDDDDDRWRPDGAVCRAKDRLHAWRRSGRRLGI